MKHQGIIIVGLTAITLLAFFPLGRCGFINFDDPGYVVNNPHVLEGLTAGNFKWAWSTFSQGNYIPLTWLSLLSDVSLFGSGPAGFHWVNVAFHVANTLLLYALFVNATGAVSRSALVAALFAIHPLRVESVAWIVERKDVVSAFFFLLAGLAYLGFVRRLGRKWYAATLLLFLMALLAKQTLATFPFLLLLLDYWPLGRWIHGPAPLDANERPRRSTAQLLLEKLPLIAVAVVILLVTLRAQSSTSSIADARNVPLGWRLANVPISYARYLAKMVWFGNLAVLYPRRIWSPMQVICATLVILAITACCLRWLHTRPWLTVGWFWFIGMLVPMIGIVQFGPQAMADRFMYVAGVGLLLMLAWSIPNSAARNPIALGTAVGTVLSLLVIFTIHQCGYWHDSVTLFTHDIQVAGSSYIAELNLGWALEERGAHAPAIEHLTTAARYRPENAKPHADLALALTSLHQDQAALRESQAAIRREPKNSDWYLVSAYVLLRMNRHEQALVECRKALALSPQSAAVHHRLGVTLCEMGRKQEGLEQFKLALAIMPHMRQAQMSLKQWQSTAAAKLSDPS